MAGHCAHARYVWNLAVEQQSWWRSGRAGAPGFVVQCRQLTAARAEFGWLRAGSVKVQQQALRDFWQAMARFFSGTNGRPTWRKAGRDEGFRIVDVSPDHLRRLSRNVGEVWVPKVGWVRFRWSRVVPLSAKSYRVNQDTAGRWHVAFAVIPDPIPGPGNGAVVGVDRGVAVSAALSTGELLGVPALNAHERKRLHLLQRKLARARRGSARRSRVKIELARLKAREANRRKDWVEKTSTDLARRFDIIRVEDLNITGMTRSARGVLAAPGKNVRAKAGLNRSILENGWGALVRRLEQKTAGRVEKIHPAFTSQTCSACGHREPGNRKSQAVFSCCACRMSANADVNAARNIAAGRAATARGGGVSTRPLNREPQLGSSLRVAGMANLESQRDVAGRTPNQCSPSANGPKARAGK